MNAPLTGSLLSAIELAPRDPILGISEAFNADRNLHKVNLGVGVYCDDNGKIPLLECVKRAEHEIAERASPRGYLPIDGIPVYERLDPRFGLAPDAATIGSVQILSGYIPPEYGLRSGAV